MIRGDSLSSCLSVRIQLASFFSEDFVLPTTTFFLLRLDLLQIFELTLLLQSFVT